MAVKTVMGGQVREFGKPNLWQKIKCLVGFHWWLKYDDNTVFGVHPHWINKCGWCGKEGLIK